MGVAGSVDFRFVLRRYPGLSFQLDLCFYSAFDLHVTNFVASSTAGDDLSTEA